MAKDQSNQGGPSRNPKDEPTGDRDNTKAQQQTRAQSQSNPEGDDERRNREGEHGGSRTGSESNASHPGRTS